MKGKYVLLGVIGLVLLSLTTAYASWSVVYKEKNSNGMGYDISCSNGNTGYAEYNTEYGTYWVGSKYFDTLDQAASYICR